MDDADRAADMIEDAERDALRRASRLASTMPVGEPGECSYCGEYFARLVNDACGRCRDKRAKYHLTT
jgi:hypothetical protein